MLFGIGPSGSVNGQLVGARTLEDITQACAEIHPRHPPLIEHVPLANAGGREVLVARVPGGAHKPYSYKGRHYLRSGAATVEMPEETQLALVMERVHGTDRWETASSSLDLEAIDHAEVQAFRDAAISSGRARFDERATATPLRRF